MKVIGVITFIVLVTLVIYSCVVVGRRADELEEKDWENKK